MTRKVASVLFAITLLLILLSPARSTVTAAELPDSSFSARQQSTGQVVIYFFWGDGCPHCAQAKPILTDWAAKDPNINVQMFEVYYDEANQNLLKEFGEAFGMQPKYVPTIFVGDQYFEGWSDEIEQKLRAQVDDYLVNGDPGKGAELVVPTTTTPTPQPTLQPTPEVIPTNEPASGETIKLPLIGEVDLSHQGLFLSTLLIAFVDGFNPCSIWVLSILLAITLHTGSRKKILIIGLVYISITALIYALFIAGLFTVFTVVSFVGWIQIVVALVALFFGVINLKDYFFYKEGVSLTISDEKKPGIYKRIRKVLEAGDSWWGLIGGTVVLAAGVSLVEFTCTAGFPVLWTNLVSSQNVPIITFLLLLLVYLVVYQLDELGLFLAAVFTLRSSKVEEKHGRILKLIGGVLMVTLSIVMLVKPSLMNSISQSVTIFGIAFGVTAVILLLHRVVLPRIGIYIGSEFRKERRKKR